MQPLILVGIGGALGAIARYLVSTLVGRLLGGTFPWGTLMINILGSLLMGMFVGLLARFMPPWANEVRLFVAVGILGGFTTFSSFSLDAVTLFERGEVMQAGFYVLASVCISILALMAGLMVTRGAWA